MIGALRAVTAVLVAALFGLLVYRVVNDRPGDHLSPTSLRGKPPAPDVRLAVIWRHATTWPAHEAALAARRRLSPRELAGHPAVINFWASWCGPCGRETPRLVKAAGRHRGKVLFLAVDMNDFTSDARRFLGRHEVDYVSLHGGPRTAEAYGLIGLPETLYLDARGRVVGRTTGEVSRRQLEQGIQKAVRSTS